MKRFKLEDLLAGGSLAAVLLLFGSFLFNGAKVAVGLVVAAGILGAMLIMRCLSNVLSARKHMLFTQMKRGMALIMAVLTFVSLPVQVLATENISETVLAETTPETTDAMPVAEEIQTPESEQLISLRERIALYVQTYELAQDMNDGDLAHIFFALDSQGAKAAWSEAHTLYSEGRTLPTAEAEVLLEEENTQLALRFLDVMQQINSPVLLETTGPHTPVSDVTVAVENSDSAPMTDGTITVSAASTSETGCGGTTYTPKTVTITISYTADPTTEKNLKFDWSSANWSSVEFDGEPPTNSSYSKTEIIENGTITIELVTSDNSADTCTFTMSNFEYKDAETSANITVNYNTALGTVTYPGSTDVLADGSETPIDADTVFTATPASGVTFLGWINAGGSLVGSEAAYTAQVSLGDQTITPMFAKSTSAAWFLAGGSRYYNDLNAAATFASTAPAKTVILLADGTLPAGNYTIPAGVKFLIPFSSDHLFCSAEPKDASMHSEVSPSAFRTLTVPSDATIICNGELHINGQRKTTGQTTTGTTQGKHGKLILNGTDTQLTVNGTLYSYGYIAGTGMVELMSGSSAREFIQICDWCGGSNALSWSMGANKGTTFLSTRYFVQNIEAPLKINYGASLNVESILTVNNEAKASSCAIVASQKSGNGLFMLGDGTYILREYDSATDRVTYTTGGNGTIDFGSIKLTVYIEMDSASYTLPLNNALTVVIGSNTIMNMGNRAALLPSSKVIVQKGATLNLSNHIYIFDKSDWAAEMSFGAQKALPYTVGRGTNIKLAIDKSGILQVDGTLNITGDGGIYTTTSGNDKEKVIAGTGTIVHNGKQATGSLQAGYGKTSVSVGTALGNLAGIGIMQPFSTGTYYGLGPDHNNYWYNYKVKAVDTTGNPVGNALTVLGNAAGTHPDIPALVGYVTYSASGQSNFQFTTTTPTVDMTMAGTPSTLSPTDGVYTLAGITADTTLTLPLTPGVIYATNIRAGDSLDLYFYIQESALEGKETFEARITRSKLDDSGNAQTITVDPIPYANWTAYEGGLRRFSYEGIAAKEMTDIVSVAIFDTSTGYQYGTTVNESIQNYAMRAFNAYENDRELRTMLVDMLNYGAAAQTHFNYTAVPLANAKLTEKHTPYASTQINADKLQDSCQWVENKNGYVYNASVTLKSDLFFNFKFTGVPEGTTAKTSYTDHYNRTQTQTFTAEGTTLTAAVLGIAAADGSQIITCTLYNSAGTEIGSAQGSVEGYVRNSLKNSATEPTLVKVCQELMKYINSANSYFTNN